MPPPVLLIHGACSHPAHMEPWADYFRAAGYHVLVPALPGHAPSDPAALARLTFDDYLAALGEVHARLDRPPIVMGHSMGGLLGQMLAATSDCAALVLLSSTPPGLIPLRRSMFSYGLPLVPRILAGRPFRPNRESLRAVTLSGLARAEQDEILADFSAESGRAFRTIAFGGVRVDPRAVQCPVLCLAGGNDRLIGPAVARDLARRYRGDLIVIPGGGHWLLAGSLLEMVAKRVLAWIDGLDERTTPVLGEALPSFRGGADL